MVHVLKVSQVLYILITSEKKIEASSVYEMEAQRIDLSASKIVITQQQPGLWKRKRKKASCIDLGQFHLPVRYSFHREIMV